MDKSSELVIISKIEIKEQINRYLMNTDKNTYIGNIVVNDQIKNNVKYAWREIKHSLPETYIFLGEYPDKILYGLYKCDRNIIYIVKSLKKIKEAILNG